MLHAIVQGVEPMTEITVDTETRVSTSASPGIRDDAFMQALLAKLPGQSGATFSDEQLVALKVALSGRSWGVHKVDLRWSFSLWHWHYYVVALAGRNRRHLSRREQELRGLALATILVVVLAASTLLGLLVLYLLKSAMGIDLIPGFSFGVWGWFKQEFL